MLATKEEKISKLEDRSLENIQAKVCGQERM